MSITVIPVVLFYFWQSVRTRSPAFFTAVNPGMYMGGLYGTPKSEINKLIPPEYLPSTLLIPAHRKKISDIQSALEQAGLSYPLIVKPNIGERGLNVSKVASETELHDQINSIEGDVLLQEYIDYGLEITVLCYKIPGTDTRRVTSVCTKEFLYVTGDGTSTLGQLIRQKPRALLQLKRLADQLDMEMVPKSGEHVQLEPIGNHNRGTRFINANHLIDDDLRKVFIQLLEQMDGVNFGRFDLRTRSVEDLKQGQYFKVLEFNGVNAEPVHIYDPDYPVWRAYKDLWIQWQLLGSIAIKQKKLGVEYCPTVEGWRAFRDYLAYKRRASSNL